MKNILQITVLIAFSMVSILWSDFSYAEPVFAQSRGDRGQAYTFEQSGVCHALIPNHIGAGSGFSIISKNGVARGSKMLRFEESDFALASVSGLPVKKCGPSWSTLSDNLDQTLQRGATAVLTSVLENGSIDRVPLIIKSVSYEHILASTINQKDDRKLQQGRSGSLISVNDVPVGLALELWYINKWYMY